jgi:hypothetical protein
MKRKRNRGIVEQRRKNCFDVKEKEKGRRENGHRKYK